MENRATVIRKVRAYVVRTCGDASEASFKKAFDACDSDHDGRCSRGEIRTLLGAAGVGGDLTRSAIVRAIMNELDVNGDGVGWDEFRAAFAAE